MLRQQLRLGWGVPGAKAAGRAPANAREPPNDHCEVSERATTSLRAAGVSRPVPNH